MILGVKSSSKALNGLQRMLEVSLILSGVLALFLLMSLVSFDPADPGWSQTGTHHQYNNQMGKVGAWLSDVLYFWLGWIAYGVPISIAFIGWLLFKRTVDLRQIDYLTLGLRLIGLVLLVTSATAISSMNFDDVYTANQYRLFSSGGVIGDVIRDGMIPFFGQTGTTLLLLCFFFTGITLATGLSWIAIIDGLGAAAIAGVLWCYNKLKANNETAVSNQTQEEAEKPSSTVEKPSSEALALTEAQNTRYEFDEQSASISQEEFTTAAPTVPVENSNSVIDERESELSIADFLWTQTPSNAEPHAADTTVKSSGPIAPQSPTSATSTRTVTLNDIVQQDEPEAFFDVQSIVDLPIEQDVPFSPDAEFSKQSAEEVLLNGSSVAERNAIQQNPNQGMSAKPAASNAETAGVIVEENALTAAITAAKARDEKRKNLPPLPTIDLLDKPDKNKNPIKPEDLERVARLLEVKLQDFNIQASVVGVYPGPVITRFELDLAPGTKVSKISGLSKDLARALSAISVRVVEVIPGKSVIGLELPNKYREIVRLSEVMECEAFNKAKSPLTMVLGADIAGEPVVVDLAKMPHLLVAGTTGSGKSVGVNTMIISLLYKSTPREVRFILIDPKMLELSVYEGIPHLLTEVVTDMKEAANSLRWCVGEMERRYKLMSAMGVRNLKGFNTKVNNAIESGEPIPDPLWKESEQFGDCAPTLEPLSHIVVVIDEFADMMMIVGKKVEELIARIAQKARAAGIHLILATQRPSVDVITGLIKANIPTRMAFQVSSRIDSRTILDQQGAENLLGQGDMLYLPPGAGVPTRVHGAFVDDHEVHAVVEDWKLREAPQYIDEILSGETTEDNMLPGEQAERSGAEDYDEFYDEAVQFVTETRRASVSSVQRKFRIGYNRAARIVEQMESDGVVSAPGHNGNREVLAPPAPKG